MFNTLNHLFNQTIRLHPDNRSKKIILVDINMHDLHLICNIKQADIDLKISAASKPHENKPQING